MGIKSTIRNKFDDMFTFGFGLKYDSDVIEQAENQFQKDRKDFTPEDRQKFEKILDELQKALDLYHNKYPMVNEIQRFTIREFIYIQKYPPGGGFKKCGSSKQKADAKRKYPKCVPAAKAASMTESQRRSAVKRKRSKAQGVGGKPTNVKTFAKAAGGGMAQRGMRFIGVR